MPLQKLNSDLVGLLSTYFPENSDPGFCWPRMYGAAMGIPRLRGYWPFTSVNESDNVLDVSGQDRTLTNNGTATFDYTYLAAHGVLNGSSQYFSRATETGIDLTNGAFFAGWFYCSRSVGSLEYFVSKGTPGTNGYHFRRTTGGVAEFVVDTKTFTTTLALPTGSWSHIAARLDSGAKMSVWVNGETETTTSSVPTGPTTNLSAFTLGRQSNSAANYFQGKLCQFVLSSNGTFDFHAWSHFQQTRGVFGV
jgi:hypothetical protein